MSYQEFKNKYGSKTNFLQFYHVVSAIPKHLATKAKNTVPPESEPAIHSEQSPFFDTDLKRITNASIAVKTIQLMNDYSDLPDHTFIDWKFVKNFVIKMSLMSEMLLIIRILLQQWKKSYLAPCLAHTIKKILKGI